MMPPEDGFGRFIAATDVKAKPPYRPTPVWDGRHNGWHLSAVRIEGDDLVHAVALHLSSGATHAERLNVNTPAGIKQWADGLPVLVAQGAHP